VCHNLLQDPKIFQLLCRMDEALAEEVRGTPCACGGKWHRADYPRKPRGCLRDFRRQYALRFSFCCSHCRKRRTSPSVRFLGRRVYLTLVILLMAGRLTARTPGAQEVCALLNIPGRTLRRWRDWWRQDFPTTALWKAEVACYLPPINHEDLPISLLARFPGPPIAAVLSGLALLTPLTLRPA